MRLDLVFHHRRTVQAAKSAVAKPFPPRVLRQLAPLLVTRYVMQRVVSDLERHPLHFVEVQAVSHVPMTLIL